MSFSSRFISACIILILALLVGATATLVKLGIPVSAAGMAAKLVCSGSFVAGRDPEDVMREDVRPANIVMHLASASVNERGKFVVSSIPGSAERYAVWRPHLGCTLLEPGDIPPPPQQGQVVAGPASRPIGSQSTGDTQATVVTSDSDLEQRDWPEGVRKLAREQWPDSVDPKRLQDAVDSAFSRAPASSFSPSERPSAGANTRAVLVAHKGRLLIEQYGNGFDQRTAQLGWSMTKTALSVLAWKHFREHEIEFDTPVVNLMRRMPRINWAAEWLRDQRASINLTDLLTMRDGLSHDEGYSIWSRVPHMLFSVADISNYAGIAPARSTPGTKWRYSSAVSNLLSRVLRDQFTTDKAYWRYPAKSIFEPIGASSAVIETDAAGTFVASSYMWATPQDWMRFAQLLANDGQWAGQQLFPEGWLQWATQTNNESNGPYGAHVWLTHAGNELGCDNKANLPTNGFVMKGHFGQSIAVFPDQEMVILRLGWTVDKSQWNTCGFIAKVLASVR